MALYNRNIFCSFIDHAEYVGISCPTRSLPGVSLNNILLLLFYMVKLWKLCTKRISYSNHSRLLWSLSSVELLVEINVHFALSAKLLNANANFSETFMNCWSKVTCSSDCELHQDLDWALATKSDHCWLISLGRNDLTAYHKEQYLWRYHILTLKDIHFSKFARIKDP